MKNLLRRSLPVAFVLANSAAGMAETPLSTDEANPKIRVLVYNMAKVPSPILVQAEKEASRIFNDAGIYLMWEECPCSQGLGPEDLMLRIIPQLFGSRRSKIGSNALGYAPASEDGGFLATVFFSRVEQVTKGGPVAPVLGNAVAHELGHLLLGQDAHTPDGIMRAYWSRDFLKLAQLGLLNFTSEQAQLMREHLSAQHRQKEILPARLIAFVK